MSNLRIIPNILEFRENVININSNKQHKISGLFIKRDSENVEKILNFFKSQEIINNEKIRIIKQIANMASTQQEAYHALSQLSLVIKEQDLFRISFYFTTKKASFYPEIKDDQERYDDEYFEDYLYNLNIGLLSNLLVHCKPITKNNLGHLEFIAIDYLIDGSYKYKIYYRSLNHRKLLDFFIHLSVLDQNIKLNLLSIKNNLSSFKSLNFLGLGIGLNSKEQYNVNLYFN